MSMNYQKQLIRYIRVGGVILIMVASLSACSIVGKVLPVSPDTYTVGSQMGGQFWTFRPSFSEVKALAINRANEFCTTKNKTMAIVSWDTHGLRGFTPLEAELTFKCVNL